MPPPVQLAVSSRERTPHGIINLRQMQRLYSPSRTCFFLPRIKTSHFDTVQDVSNLQKRKLTRLKAWSWCFLPPQPLACLPTRAFPAPCCRVLPVSAERALLSRQVLNNTASQNVKEDCCELMFGQDWDEQVRPSAPGSPFWL